MNPVYFQTQFATSAQKLHQLPTDSLAEVAFAGRSNAGKSSAINVITRNRKLARTSKTPGRTQLLNCFLVEEGRYLVDLPGYGYAKVPLEKLKAWQNTLNQYFVERQELKCLVLVMDIRRPLTDHDWTMIEWVVHADLNLHLLLTKADKLSRNQVNKALFKTQGEIERAGIEATLQTFSALKEQGVDDAHELLDMYLYPEQSEL